MKYTSDKDIDKMICALVREGASVHRTGTNHLVLTFGGLRASIPCTPSCRRARAIVRQRLKPIVKAITQGA